MTQDTTLSTSTIGRHSELLAMAALLADGWSVSEPTVPEAHDLIAVRGDESLRIQVKTIKLREKEGVPYYVIRGLKNSGATYMKSDCDAFIGVVGMRVFLTKCEGLTEYWVRVDHGEEKWKEISITINGGD